MTRNDYLAIAAGLVAGYFLVKWMARKSAANQAPAAPAAPSGPGSGTVPAWAEGDATLTDIWLNGF